MTIVANNNITVSKINDGVNGTNGRGVSNVAQKWLVQSSSTKPNYAWTDSRWQTILPAMSATNKFLYTIERTTYTDATTSDAITLSAVYGDNGNKGDPTGITRSTTEPATRYTGMLWQYTGTVNLAATGITALPGSLYVWAGSAWQLYLVKSTNLQVDNGFITNAMIGDAQIESAKIKSLDAVKVNAINLSTISSDLGNASAGTVKLMADVDVNGTLKKHGIYQSKLGLLSSGPSLSTPNTLSNSQMGVANLNKGELRFMVTDYTEDLKAVQEAGMSDQNNAFIKFDSYDNGKDVMLIGSSGDIVFKGITSQDTPWITLSSGVKYKYMFSRVYISFAITGTSAQYMQFGFLPANLRPTNDQFLVLAAWSTGISDNRHINIRPSDGAVILWNPVNGVKYYSEVSFTL